MKYRKIFDNYRGESYLKDSGESTVLPDDMLDSSLGVNPYGHSKKIDKWMADNIDKINVTDYPEYPYAALKEKIADYLKTNVQLDGWNIGLSTGSICVLVSINRMFIDPGCRVLMPAPSFSSYETDVRLEGGELEYYYLPGENGYKFEADGYCAKMNDSFSLFYIDNPNNPTGQIIPFEEICKVVKKANELDIPIIVDEAYGEFMEISNSASGLLEKYRNLIVVKSFSKGFGLAGLRAGYAMMDKAAADIFSKACFEMSLNEFAYRTVAMALEDTQHVKDSLVKIAENKRDLLGVFTKLVPAYTSLTTPIMLLETKKNVDLYDIFMKHHVISESGADFTAIDKRFVRVRISGDDRLKNKIREIEAEEDI